MKTKLAVILSLALIALAVHAQTNTPAVPVTPPSGLISDIGDIIKPLAQASNWIVAPYGIYDLTTKKAGAGIAGVYNITPNFASVIRVDYINSQIWRPSGSLQFQLPILLFNKVTVTPLVFTGLSVPLGGTGGDNGAGIVIAGVGGSITLKQNKLYIVGDWEVWKDSKQLRGGLAYRF